MSKINKNLGYSLVEVIIYVSILAVIYFLIVDTLLSFNTSYKNIVALRVVDSSAVNFLERATRDIKGANTVDIANSTFGGNSGVLTIVSSYSGVSTTTKFYLDSGVIKMDINGTYYGPLTLSSAAVSSLTFTKIDSDISNLIKIDVVISGNSGNVSKTKNYHTTSIMKLI